jgi:hypothetical protein
MQFRTQATQASGRGGAAVSPAATTTDAPLLPGDATATCQTAKGGAIGTKAEGNRLGDRSQSRSARREANGPERRAARTARSQAEPTGLKGEVCAGSAGGRWPNPAHQRIAAWWRICPN